MKKITEFMGFFLKLSLIQKEKKELKTLPFNISKTYHY